MLLRGTVCCSAVHHVHMGTEPHHVPNARSGRSFQAMAVPRFWHVYKNMHFIIIFLVYTNVKYFMNQLSVTTTSRSRPVGVFFLPSSPSRGSPGEQASLATCFDGQEIGALLNKGNWKLLAHGLFTKDKLAASVTACIYSAFPLA